MNLKLKYFLIWLVQVAAPSVVLLGAPYIGLIPKSHTSRIVEIVAGLALIVVLALVNLALYRHESARRERRFLQWCRSGD